MLKEEGLIVLRFDKTYCSIPFLTTRVILGDEGLQLMAMEIANHKFSCRNSKKQESLLLSPLAQIGS